MDNHSDQKILEERIADLENSVQDQRKALLMHMEDHEKTNSIMRKLLRAIQSVFTEE